MAGGMLEKCQCGVYMKGEHHGRHHGRRHSKKIHNGRESNPAKRKTYIIKELCRKAHYDGGETLGKVVKKKMKRKKRKEIKKEGKERKRKERKEKEKEETERKERKERKARRRDLTHDSQLISIEGKLIDLFLGISQEGVKERKKDRK